MKKLKEEAKKRGLQVRIISGDNSEDSVDVSPMGRFGITEAEITKKLFLGLISLYNIEQSAGQIKGSSSWWWKYIKNQWSI